MDMQSSYLPLYTLETNVETSAGDVYTYEVVHPLIVRDFVIAVVGEVLAVDTAAPVIAVDVDPAASARVEKGRVTLADGDAIGKARSFASVDPTDMTPFPLVPGDKIIVEQITAGTDGTAVAGRYIVYALVQWKPDGVV